LKTSEIENKFGCPHMLGIIYAKCNLTALKETNKVKEYIKFGIQLHVILGKAGYFTKPITHWFSLRVSG